MSDDNQIYFVVEEQNIEEIIHREGERNGTDIGGGWGEPRSSRVDAIRSLYRKRVGIKPAILKAQLQDMMGVVNELFEQEMKSSESQTARGLQLDEVTLSVQVNAKGELSILGTGGELGGSGGITLKFVKPKG